MAKVLSDKTAEWLKNQINSRDISSHQRPRAPISTNASGGCSAIVATVVSHKGGGVYVVTYINKQGLTETATTVTLVNSMFPCEYYAPGDLMLCHLCEVESAVGDISTIVPEGLI